MNNKAERQKIQDWQDEEVAKRIEHLSKEFDLSAKLKFSIRMSMLGYGDIAIKQREDDLVGELEKASREIETDMSFLKDNDPEETRTFNAREFNRDTNAIRVDVIKQIIKTIQNK